MSVQFPKFLLVSLLILLTNESATDVNVEGAAEAGVRLIEPTRADSTSRSATVRPLDVRPRVPGRNGVRMSNALDRPPPTVSAGTVTGWIAPPAGDRVRLRGATADTQWVDSPKSPDFAAATLPRAWRRRLRWPIGDAELQSSEESTMRALIVSEGRSRAALAGARALGRAGGDVGSGTPDGGGLVDASRFVGRSHRVPLPERDLDAFLDGVARAVGDGGYEVVFGSGDAEILALSLGRDGLGASVGYGPHESLLRAIDKLELAAA